MRLKTGLDLIPPRTTLLVDFAYIHVQEDVYRWTELGDH